LLSFLFITDPRNWRTSPAQLLSGFFFLATDYWQLATFQTGALMIHTCTFIYDNGGICNSAAVRGGTFCASHLHHRARLMRIAQVRARNERFDLKLPPIESMPTVLSALNHIVEAVAADMLDLKRADFLLKSLRFAAQALKNSDLNAAEDAPSLSSTSADDRVGEVDLAAQYGLPNDLDLNLSPESAFPPPAQTSDLSSRAERSEVEGPAFSGYWQPATGYRSPMPTVAYCDHGPGCPQHTIRIDYPETPELAELREIKETQGMDAVTERYKQQQRNHRRREVLVGRKRYAAIALEKNMRLAAERLAERKLAERAAQPAVEEGWPIPPSVGGVGLTSSDENAAAKKPPASAAATSEAIATKEEATA
jgi:hypothetical protein